MHATRRRTRRRGPANAPARAGEPVPNEYSVDNCMASVVN
jgi:hypothetical protein